MGGECRYRRSVAVKKLRSLAVESCGGASPICGVHSARELLLRFPVWLRHSAAEMSDDREPVESLETEVYSQVS